MRAHDPMIGRIVALKLFSPALAQGEGRNRFLQEARVVGQLSHPCIITLHDMGIEESTKTPYLVMEFVEGGNLRDFLKIRGKLEPGEALRLIEDAVSGVSYAYSRGVTHRDMKLTNVLIASQGAAKLVDFGLAGIFSRKGLELDPESAQLRHALGLALYWMGDGEGAEKQFVEVLRRSPDHVETHVSLGILFAQRQSTKPSLSFSTGYKRVERFWKPECVVLKSQ